MKIYPIQDFINHDSDFGRILKSMPPIGEGGPWIAGGSVWKSMEGRPLESDIDIFFKSPQQCVEWYRTLLSIPYAHRIVSESKINKYNTSLKYCVKCGTKNKVFTLQLISFKFFDSIKHLLEDFDFTVCQFGVDGDKFYTGDRSLDDLRNRDIVFNHVSNCFATITHLKKYVDVGFKVSQRQKELMNEMIIVEERTKKEIKDKINSTTLTNPALTNSCADISTIINDMVIPEYISEYISDGPSSTNEGYPEPVVGSDSVDLASITSYSVNIRENAPYSEYRSNYLPARGSSLSETFNQMTTNEISESLD